LKVERGTVSTAFSDEVTDGSNLARAAGRFEAIALKTSVVPVVPLLSWYRNEC
jgi:hypothetical protein